MKIWALSPGNPPRRFGWADAVFLCLSPIIAFVLLRIAPLQQYGYLDPWLYTGGGQILRQLIECYQYPYYLVRFPVLLLNQWFGQLAGEPYAGYVLLRYSLVLVSGGLLYEMVRRSHGRTAAALGYLFLFCSPHFVRAINWDLTIFLSIPAALAGAAIWLQQSERCDWRHGMAGAMFCLTFHSHVFTMVAVGCFGLGLLLTQLWERRSCMVLLGQSALAAAGFCAVWLAGWWYYHIQFGTKSPLLFWEVTKAAMAAGSDYATSHARPFASWAFVNTYWWVPYLWLVAGWVLTRRSEDGRGRFTERTVMVTATLFGVFYLAYRFVLGRFVIEEAYYFSHIWAVFCLLIPVVCAQMLRRESRSVLLGALIATVWILLAGLAAARQLLGWSLLNWANGVTAISATVLVALAGLIMARGMKWRAWRWSGFLGFIAATQILSVISPHHGVYGNKNRALERDTYRAGIELAHTWARHARANQIPLQWYGRPGDTYSIWSASFTTLGDTLHSKWSETAMPTLSAYELDRLRMDNFGVLLLVTLDVGDFPAAHAALDAAGLEYRELERVTVAKGEVKFFIEVLHYTPLPPS